MTRTELYSYLDSNYAENFLVRCPEECVLHFMRYEDVYFESPVDVRCVEMGLDEYMDGAGVDWDYERGMQRGDRHFIVEAYQTDPWIDEIEIIRPMTDSEVVDWYLSHPDQAANV